MDTRELRRHVVRIVDGSGATLGTGFFVTHGRVLTAAHVVAAEREVVVIADPEVHDRPFNAVVLARSADPAGAALWPFPDLAVLRLGPGPVPDHPCVPLAAEDPGTETECHAWGFARREYGLTPVGSPASFRFEGVEGDGYFRLKAGQASPGLSGAPLLCPSRRAVVGVVTASRNVESDLGGWAAPVAALLRGGPGVPGELAALGRELVTLNEQAVLAGRAAWHRVLPVRAEEARGALEQPWAPFSRGPRTSPADLLRADFGVVPFAFRDTVLDTFTTWCEGSEDLAIAQIAAPGGAGKTRFALELAARLAGRGWVSGLWTRARPHDRILSLPLPRLLVIDYAEAVDTESLCTLLEALHAQATPLSPVRVLMLTRGDGASARAPLGRLDEDAPAVLRAVVDRAREVTEAEWALTIAQRRELYARAVTAFAAAWGTAPPAPGSSRPDLSTQAYARPLDVLFEAHDTVLSGGAGAQDSPGGPPLDRTLSHERRYWRTTAPALAGVGVPQRRRCVAAVTLAGAADARQAHDLIAAALPGIGVDDRQLLVDWLADAYSGPGLLNPLRPDRLGERLLAEELDEEERHAGTGRTPLVRAALALPSDDQVIHALETLARLAASVPATCPGIASAFAGELHRLVQRAEDAFSGTLRRPGRSAFVSGLLRCLTGPVSAALLPATADDSCLDTAIALLRLGDLARTGGRGQEAEVLYVRSRELYEERLGSDPDSRRARRELALVLGRLGETARARGELVRAAREHRRALLLIDRLLEEDGTNRMLRHDAAACYDRLGELARLDADWQRAEQLYRRSLGFLVSLAESPTVPGEHQRDLTVAHNRLGDLLRGLGRAEDAEDHYRHALSITERLCGGTGSAVGGPDLVLLRDLAVGRGRLGDLLRERGQPERAERLYAASLEAREQLAGGEPANATYRRDLSLACARLGDLVAERGDRERAAEFYRRSSDLAQELAESEPGNAAYRSDLAAARGRLATVAGPAPAAPYGPVSGPSAALVPAVVDDPTAASPHAPAPRPPDGPVPAEGHLRGPDMRELSAMFREVAGVEESLEPGAGLQDVPFIELGYDSLALLQVVGSLERSYGVEFDDEKIAELETPRQLLKAVQDQLGPPQEPDMSLDGLHKWLAARVAHHTGLPAGHRDAEVPLSQIPDFDSVVFYRLLIDVQKTFHVYLPGSVGWETPTLSSLARDLYAAVTRDPPAGSAVS
ncbi:phosphopantetheine-binding protein [Streptomyces sp. NPDC002187]|uniref:phosphopantetheine-binding protein n=1 Tax=Streptomyces sp. NPDC002187 TaxID=3364637 RepID=UPI0036B1840F